jgi:hypothetical protein
MLASVVASCGDECSSYSSFSCKQIEAADYNVYFYFPSGDEQYLGQANGLRQCSQNAHSFAASKKLSQERWGYICCMIARGSACYEKHR